MGNLFIVCKSKKEEKEVLKKLEKQGKKWSDYAKPTEHSYFLNSHNEYAIIVNGRAICYTANITRSMLWNENSKKISAAEFLKENKETIVIYRNGAETIAIDQSTGKKAVAKCHPDDTYDFYTGAKLAVERLTEPEYYNGKVVCVDLEERHKHLLTKGKVYEFVDGILTYDNGSTSISKIKSFEEIKEAFLSEFIELVE